MRKKSDIVVQNFDNETLIYDLTANKAFCLNQTSAVVWQFCDGTKSIAQIADLMSKDLKMPVSEDFVWLAIGDLQKESLVEVENNQPFFEGKTRREVIRKIGFASMIVLPLISSLVAPRAVDAASGCQTLGQTCVPDNYRQGTCCTSNLRCNNDARTCAPCIASNSTYVSGPTSSAPECQNACLVYANSFGNLCCSTAPRSFTFSSGICSCRCG